MIESSPGREGVPSIFVFAHGTDALSASRVRTLRYSAKRVHFCSVVHPTAPIRLRLISLRRDVASLQILTQGFSARVPRKPPYRMARGLSWYSRRPRFVFGSFRFAGMSLRSRFSPKGSQPVYQESPRAGWHGGFLGTPCWTVCELLSFQQPRSRDNAPFKMTDSSVTSSRETSRQAMI